MAVYYSATTRSFYDDRLVAKPPSDAVPVTDAEHVALMTAQATGMVITPDATGAPQATTPVRTVAQALAALGALYASKENAGVAFQASGATAPSTFPSNLNAQVKLVSAFSMANVGLWVDGTPWISVSGISVPMVKSDILALAPKVAAHVAACTANYGHLIPLVQADPAADTSGGWPDA